MRILVTGGCGFIGSNFIRYMFQTYPGVEITNLDKLTYAGNPENLRDIEGEYGYTFVRGDIRDKELVGRVLGEGFDGVLNFAAESHVDRSISGPMEFIQTDVFGTFTLLEECRGRGISRYVQISTDEVYGSIEDGSFTEDSPIVPNSPYAASKAGGDLLVRAYHQTYGMPVIITRSSNNFGPYQYPEKLIPLFITNALEDIALPLYGDGLNVRDWLFVSDNCQAIDLVLRKGEIGEVYNIGGGQERTNIEITRAILSILGKPESLIEYVDDRPGHDRRYSLEFDKTRALGFEPRMDFEAMMEETVRWYVDNRSWWEPLKHRS
ncbi:MAG: dTDP-glucose 4,6-dehydratase [Actinomycetia bacterium]|nr:dTDP-glucose 4,6-dehydratase [Actinomycetota bacterium]MBU4301790.1 dTDP-glucose 4,6-dehydratase [Actinomycetota bacterium]MCG2796666.1 dTDP-glucose 4,6-dehydratase [Actinomycetes bacterium]